MGQLTKLASECELGNKKSCAAVARLSIYAANFKDMFEDAPEDERAADVSDHPNHMPFRGTLLILDAPSDKPPHGSEGHRILVPAEAAQRKINTLINQGLNYAPDLAQHAPRRKVGVITKAWIDGNQLKIAGTIWKKDFPEAEQDLRQGGLGMSMELANVYVRDRDEPVWYLEDFDFTGATALKRNAAAYSKTALAAAAVALAEQLTKREGGTMPVPKKKTAAAAGGGNDLVAAFEKALSKAVSPLANAINAQSERIEVLASAINADNGSEEEVEIEAAGGITDAVDDSSGGDTEEEVEAADEGIEELSDGAGDEEHEPGKMGKQENHGDKKTVTKVAASRRVAPRRMAAAAARVDGIEAAGVVIDRMAAQLDRAHTKIAEQGVLIGKYRNHTKKLSNRIESIEAQFETFANNAGRKTVTPEVSNLMAKQGYDIGELQAAGTKLRTEQIDQALDNCGVSLEPSTRMAIKNQLYGAGVMETGEIRRH